MEQKSILIFKATNPPLEIRATYRVRVVNFVLRYMYSYKKKFGHVSTLIKELIAIVRKVVRRKDVTENISSEDYGGSCHLACTREENPVRNVLPRQFYGRRQRGRRPQSYTKLEDVGQQCQ